MMLEILCFLAVLYIVLKIYCEQYKKQWQHFEEAPLKKTTFLGHISGLRDYSGSKFTKKIGEWFENSKDDTFLLWFSMQPTIFTRNKKVFEELLTSNTHIAKSKNYWVLSEWLGDALALTSGDHWRQKRKLLTPSFHFNILSNFVPIMEKHSKDLGDSLKTFAETGTEFDAFKIMKLYSTGIISETAMGIDCNILKAVLKNNESVTKEEQEAIEFVQALTRVLSTLFLRGRNPFYWYKYSFKLFAVGKEYYKDLEYMKTFAMKIIEKRIQNLQETNTECNNEIDEVPKKKLMIFLDSMLKHYQDGIYSVDEIVKETQSFMFGGFDTIATALAWTLYMLGRNHVQQEQAYQEVQRIKALDLPIGDAIRELNYVECVIKETLRIHPSAPMIGRHISKDTIFNSVLYPKGSAINLCIQQIQRDAKNWEDPMKFKPERFLNVENGINIKENVHFSNVPFSAGPRNCIGQRFAMMEMKITLYHILSRFEVVALQKEDELIETNDFIHHVANEEGLQMQLKQR